MRNVKPILIKTGAHAPTGHARRWCARILFPAALPEIFTGIRVGFSLTLIGTLLGEMFAAQRGLGYLLMNAIGLHNVDLIMAVTLHPGGVRRHGLDRAAVDRPPALPAHLTGETVEIPVICLRRSYWLVCCA